MRILALGIAALITCSNARAIEPREVHVDIGSSDAPLIATVHVEDYRAAPLDLLKPAASGDSRMTRFLKTYYEIGRSGDTKRVASLFERSMQAGVNEHYPTPQSLSDQFADLRSAHLSAVVYWGEHQFGVVEHEQAVAEGGTRRWMWPHATRCVGDTCQIIGHFQNSQLGRVVAAAFADKGGVPLAVPAQGETPLPILPVVTDAAQKTVATDPIVLHLNRSSDRTTLAVTTAVSTLPDSQRGPSTVSSVYSLGPNVCVALLKSEQARAVNLLPLQRTASGWELIADPSSLDAWRILSSTSTYQALQSR
jgi:hypothetical protein